MNKKRTLGLLMCLAFPAFIASCTETGASDQSSDNSTQDDIDLEAALSKAKESVYLEGQLTSIYVDDGDSYDEGNLELTITDDFVEWKKDYSDNNGQEITYDYSFSKGKRGQMVYDRLNILNEVETVDYINPAKETSFDYNKYCKNPFDNLFASDLSLIEGRYYLSDEKVNDFANLLSLMTTTEFKMYEVTLSSVSFSYQNGKFKDVILTTSPQSDELLTPADFFFDCTFKLLFPGSNVEKKTIATKEHRPEHDTLKTALGKLQEVIATENYTIHAVDQEDGGELGAEYDNYATSEGFYSDFKPVLYNYKFGYTKQEDGKYHRYIHYVAGDKKGTVTYLPNASYGIVEDRKELEPQFNSFATEFFVKNNKTNTYSTTLASVLDEIKGMVTPFYDKQDWELNATKIFFNLDSKDEISSWGINVYSWASGYSDTITYTLKDVGTTTLPSLTE